MLNIQKAVTRSTLLFLFFEFLRVKLEIYYHVKFSLKTLLKCLLYKNEANFIFQRQVSVTTFLKSKTDGTCLSGKRKGYIIFNSLGWLKTQVTGYRLQVTGCRLHIVGFRLQVTQQTNRLSIYLFAQSIKLQYLFEVLELINVTTATHSKLVKLLKLVKIACDFLINSLKCLKSMVRTQHGMVWPLAGQGDGRIKSTRGEIIKIS